MVIALFTLSGCETDVDIMAPYKSTPVIYAVLDHTVDTQFVRINRTYLGEGNVSDYAAIKDSVEYPVDMVEAKLFKYHGNNLLDSILLETIEVPSRSPGVFYRQNVLFYYTAEPLFTESEIAQIEEMRYEMRVKIDDKVYTASTDFPKTPANTIKTPPLPATPFKLALVTASGVKSQTDFEIRMHPTVLEYENVFRLNFDYYTHSGETHEDEYIDFRLTNVENPNRMTGERKIPFSTSDWFNVLHTRLGNIDDLKNVRIKNAEYRVTAASADLVLYRQVAHPVSDFTPVTGSYSNFSGDAIGIFASKSQSVRVVWFTDPVLEALNNSPETGEYCFCTENWGGNTDCASIAGCN